MTPSRRKGRREDRRKDQPPSTPRISVVGVEIPKTGFLRRLLQIPLSKLTTKVGKWPPGLGKTIAQVVLEAAGAVIGRIEYSKAPMPSPGDDFSRGEAPER